MEDRRGGKGVDDWTLPVTGERASDARSENPKETPPGLGLRMPIIRGGGMGVVDVGTGGPE